jgi:uncharacterized membrane protein
MNGPVSVLPPFERTLVRVMLAGVWLSSTALAVGLALLLLSQRHDEAWLTLRAGLMMLMATPVLRVVMSVGEAIRQRDWFWFWATVAVALILTATVVYSLTGR